MSTPYLLPASLEWKITDSGQKTPFSKEYDESYFSVENGLEETRYVFLDGIEFDELVQAQPYTVIAETGFGSGLSFLTAWQRFKKIAPSTHRLHFLSIEEFPFRKEDLQIMAECWPELNSFYESLQQQYPPFLKGIHRLFFDEGRVTLDLCFGFAEDILPEIQSQSVHAWFLDGFSPAKNKAFWTENTFSDIRRISKTGARFASFTVAGPVRRGLESQGVQVEKRTGYGRKRECLKGKLLGTYPSQPLSSVRIVGAGFAGSSLVYALHQKGISVTLYDQDLSFKTSASDNPAALFSPWLSVDEGIDGRIHRAAYLYAHRLYDSALIWIGEKGLLKPASTSQQINKFRKLVQNETLPPSHMQLYSKEKASSVYGSSLENPCLYFPFAGSINPKALRSFLLGSVSILDQSCDFETFEKKDKESVVFCTGVHTNTLVPDLDLVPNQGQVHFVASSSTTNAPQKSIAGQGYLSPHLENGLYLAGASYKRFPKETKEFSYALEKDNYEQIQKKVAQLHPEGSEVLAEKGRVSYRATTLNHLPLLTKEEEQVYIFTGLGSRGVLTAPLCAEILASHLLEIPLPIERSLAARLWHRNRYKIFP